MPNHVKDTDTLQNKPEFLTPKFSIDKNRLTTAGVGLLSPVTTNDTEEEKAKNRRVELIKK